MKKIAVKDIQEGTVFSEPVYIEGKNLFATAGEAVRKKDLLRLHSWGVTEVETEGHPVAFSAQAAEFLSDEGRAAQNGASGTTSPEARRNYLDWIERIDIICSSISKCEPVQARAVNDIASQIMLAVKESENAFVSFVLGGGIQSHHFAKSLINTTILAALIAMKMKLSANKIMSIVTAGLLHDVGMLRLPDSLVHKKGSLSTTERLRIHSHTLLTYTIVMKELVYPADIGLIVLQHHERWDGEGYPRRLSGKAIDIGARIVAVADAFEAMISHKAYRNPIMGYQAMKNLLADNLRHFDPDVIKAFIQTMGIYPIGSLVLLNNGAMALVVNVQKTAPLRPKVKILVDESGAVFKNNQGKEIDLLAEKNIFIAKALDPKEAAKKYA
ncbi:MAG: HD-GYP domain-containing protein [Treponema sp.]|nr:HD-GYP domain-containing protein [Treponema sp.]